MSSSFKKQHATKITTNDAIVMLVNIGLDSKKRTLPLKFFIKNEKHPSYCYTINKLEKKQNLKNIFFLMIL
ncbi:hypothetical protein UBN71_09890 [Helicobacter pylori]